MRLKTVLTVNYVYAFLFGAGFTLFPTLCSSLMGFDVAGDFYLIARCLGLFVTVTGVLTFLTRNAPRSEARRAVVISMFTLYLLLIIYKVLLNLVHGMHVNLMFITIYVIHIGFVIAYGHFLLGGPKEIQLAPSATHK